MFKMKFPTKRIFRIFHILRINGMAPFCNLFMERPSYIHVDGLLVLELLQEDNPSAASDVTH